MADVQWSGLCLTHYGKAAGWDKLESWCLPYDGSGGRLCFGGELSKGGVSGLAPYFPYPFMSHYFPYYSLPYFPLGKKLWGEQCNVVQLCEITQALGMDHLTG